MELQSIFSELKRQKIKVWVDGEKLKYRTAEGSLPPDLRDQIKTYKNDIIDFLMGSQKNASAGREIAPVSRSETLPVSFAEEGLWFVSALHCATPVFQYFSAYALSETFDEHKFVKSLQHVVGNHEILRTRYLYDNKTLIRKIDDPSYFDVRTVAISSGNDSDCQEVLLEALSNEKSQKMDLTKDACFQVSFFKQDCKFLALSFKIHHIAYDDQSLSVLWREISSAYDALLEGKTLVKAEQTIQYADFAYWQRNQDQKYVNSDLEFWKKQLTGAPQIIELPKEKKRSTTSEISGAELTRSVGQKKLNALDAICQKTKTTRFMALLGVLNLLLHRYSGQSTVLVGTPVSNRRNSELNSVLGCFLDTLVLRSDYYPEQTFCELLENVQQTTLNAFEYQNIPFEKLVEYLNPDRTSNAHPIFQVMFNYIADNESRSEFNLPGCKATRLAVSGSIHADFDLKLTITEHKDSLNCCFLYNADLFSESIISCFADHMFVLLDSALDKSEIPVSSLNYLTDAERKVLIDEWNDTDAYYSEEESLVKLFEQRVELTPEKAALIHNGVKNSYQELNSRANRLAHYMKSRGVCEQTVVGVFLHRSFEVSVALLAIFKLNAVYLPLDASYPKLRLERMIKMSNAKCIITLEKMYQEIDHLKILSICIDSRDKVLEGMPDGNLLIRTEPDSHAYIVFTSGSTGVPKGVCVRHRQILNRLHWMWSSYPFAEDDVSCQKTAISFVDSLWELLGPLLKGSSTVLIGDETTRHPELLLQSLIDCRVTRLWVVPTLLQLLLTTSKKTKQLPNSLRFVVSSGEPLPLLLAENVSDFWPNVAIYNLYGTSEAWDSTWYEYRSRANCFLADQIDNSLNVPIGKPINNTQAYILDQQLNPVAKGVVGQLYVGGQGLAAFSIEDERSSGTQFISNPWRKNERIYATGDYGRHTADGEIELLGRENGFTNIRGYRVDPAEIEQNLMQIDGIDSVSVVSKSNNVGDNKLVAFIVVNTNSENIAHKISSKSIRQHLKLRLPHYMIPADFVMLSELPLTPSGKIDRSALLGLESIGSSLESPVSEPPKTKIESDIFTIWQKILGTKNFGVNDNFFDIGGNSLLAVSLFEELNNLTGVTLELTSLFEAPTISDQAGLINSVFSNTSAMSSLVPIVESGKGVPLFFVPPAAGTGLNYRQLGDGLDSSQSVYTFNLSIENRKRGNKESISAMASRLIVEMKLIQNQGPYCIGGMCLGGVVAWEMARQLTQSNEQVGCVMLLDSTLPFIGPSWKFELKKPSLVAILHQNIVHLILHKFSSQSRKRVLRRAKDKILRRWVSSIKKYKELLNFQENLLNDYKAVSCDVDTYMVCSREFFEKEHYLERWKSLIVGQLQLDVLEHATHLEMLADNRENMVIVGNKIQKYMDTRINGYLEESAR